MWSEEAWAQTTSYVLNDGGSYELHTISTGPSFTLSGPGATITFEACKDPASVDGLYIETSTDNNKWSQLGGEINVKANSWGLFSGTTWNWTSYTVNISDTNVRYIRFLTKTGATLVKYYRNY